MENKPILNLENLAHTYKDTSMQALKDINLQIYKSEFICLLGPSGCGKSTLLNIIAGLIKASEGKAYMNGVEIKGPDKNRGLMFQTNTLYPWLNVRENIEFGPDLQGIDKQKRQEISQKLLQEVGLSDFAEAKPYDLSGGMRQRVAMARALANEPELILMDEAFGALDAMTRRKMQQLIRKLWIQTKCTIFLITHDIDEALALGTRILLMSNAPGTIEKSFDIGYTYKALENPKARVHIDAEYIALKEEILDWIEQ